MNKKSLSEFRKPMLFVSLSLLLLCLIGIILWNWSVQPGCPYLRVLFQNKCEYSRSFDADTLLLDESFFHIDVRLAKVDRLAYHGAAERFAVDVYLKDGNDALGGQEISRWASSARAEEIFLEASVDEFKDTVFPCCIASLINYDSPVASKFIVRCSTANYCKAIGQYQDYVSIVGMKITDRFKIGDFEDLLIKIDTRIGKSLGRQQ